MDIDFVVTWVDGNDEEWLKEKRQYMPDVRTSNNDGVNRYRDWGIMQYWFRSVEKYAPWVRRIHFITYGHLPSFLNKDNPKLNIVTHKDYIPPQYLPTYNSNTIEMNVWRIDGLADRFVLFNDDMFLTKQVREEDFFDGRTGLPKAHFMEIPVRFDSDDSAWQIVVGNDIGMINKHFKKKDCSILRYPGRYLSFKYPFSDNLRSLSMKLLFPEYYVGFKNYHGLNSFLTSSLKELWDVEYASMDRNSKHKFRMVSEVNQWCVAWWQFAKGLFVPRKNAHKTFSLDQSTVEEICGSILDHRYESICINDPDYEVDFDVLSERIRNAFETALPDKSSFEV